MAGYRRLLKQRNFLALFLGQVISRLGDGMFKIAITWVVWRSTSSPVLVALSLILQAVPPLLFSFVAGIAADRYVHRNQMLITDAVRFGATALMAVLAGSGGIDYRLLIGMGFLLTSGSSFFGPARAAILPRLIEKADLDAANGLLAGSFHAALLFGPLIGGWMLTFTTARTLLMADALTFLVSLATLLLLPVTTSRQGQAPPSVYADARAGLATVKRNPALLWVVGTFGIGTFLTGGVFDVGQPLVIDRVGGGAAGLGMLSTALGVGVIVGSLLCGRVPLRYRTRTVMLAWAADGLLLILFGLSRSLWAATLLVLIMGINLAYINVPTESLIQMNGPGETGKVYSYWNINIWLGQTAGLACISPLFNRLPLPMVLGICGLIVIVLALVGVQQLWGLSDDLARGERT